MYFGVNCKHTHLINFNCTIQIFYLFTDFQKTVLLLKLVSENLTTMMMNLSFTLRIFYQLLLYMCGGYSIKVYEL